MTIPTRLRRVHPAERVVEHGRRASASRPPATAKGASCDDSAVGFSTRRPTPSAWRAAWRAAATSPKRRLFSTSARREPHPQEDPPLLSRSSAPPFSPPRRPGLTEFGREDARGHGGLRRGDLVLHRRRAPRCDRCPPATCVDAPASSTYLNAASSAPSAKQGAGRTRPRQVQVEFVSANPWGLHGRWAYALPHPGARRLRRGARVLHQRPRQPDGRRLQALPL